MNSESSRPPANPVAPVTVRHPLAQVLRHAAQEYYQEDLYEADLGHMSQEEIDRMTESRRAKPSADDS